MSFTRRDFLTGSAAALAATVAGSVRESRAASAAEASRMRIGMTDWNLGERGNTEKLELARQIGLDGVQVSILYPEDGTAHLRCPQKQAEYRKAALQTGMQICSLAIGDLGPGAPFKSEPMGVMRVAAAVEVAAAVGTDDILLPMFRKNVPLDEAEFSRMINALKEMAPRAEQLGVCIALETSMSADEHLKICEAVASPAVGVYMDPWNCAYYGHDPLQDVPRLKDYIHQVHVKNGDFLMSQPCQHNFQWPAIAELLDKIGYKGWLVLETGAPSKDLVADTRKNIEYVQQTFRA